MLLPVILAALLSVDEVADQPIAPVAPGSASGALHAPFLTVETTSRRFVIIGRDIREVSEYGVRPFATLPGAANSVTAIGEDLLVVVDGYRRRSMVRVHADGTIGSPRPLDVVSSRAPIAASGNRVVMFAEHEAEVLLFDGGGFLIRRFLAATDFPVIMFPTVAAGEDSFLIAWVENHERLYARAVARDGSFLSDALLISNDATRPAIASDGRGFLLTSRSFGNVEARRMTFDGRLLGDAFFVDPSGGEGSAPVGWDGVHYSVLFEKNRDLHRVDISRDGEITDRTVVASGPEIPDDPAVSGSLMAWRQWTPCYTAERIVAMLPNREPVLASIGNPVRYGAQSAAVGDTFATVWLDRTDFLRARARVGEKVVDLSDHAVNATPAIATAEEGMLIVWAESDESPSCRSHLIAAVLDEQGTVLARAKIESRSFHFAAASDGTDFVVIWTSVDTGSTSLHAMRLDAAGKVIDRARQVAGEPLQPPWLTHWIFPSIVWDGSEYLAVWQRLQKKVGVLLQRLSRTLGPVESVRTLSNTDWPLAEIAAGTTSTLIVQRDGRGISGIVLNRNGSVVAETLLRAELPDFSVPAVAARGLEFLVVAGDDVLRVGSDGSSTHVTTLPGGATDLDSIPDRSVAVSNGRAQITYEREGEIYVRMLSFRVRSARSR